MPILGYSNSTANKELMSKYEQMGIQLSAVLKTLWEKEKLLLFPQLLRRPFTCPFLHSSIYKYEPITTKLGQNVYDPKISDEFDYGTNWTELFELSVLELENLSYLTLFTL